MTPPARRRPRARLRPPRRRRAPRRRDPRRLVHGDRRAERVRQVDAAARARPPAQAAPRRRLPRRRADHVAAVEGGRARARPAAAELDRAGRDHGRRPRRPRPLPAPAAAAPVVARRRARGRPRRWPPRASATSPTGSSTSCPAASASACGWRWRSRSRRRSCCSTSRRRSSTSPTRSRCSTCAPSCTPSAAARSWPCCTTSTRPCRYATHLVAMRDGAIVAQGEPAEIVTAELVEAVFGLPCRVIDDPEAGTPLVVPAARGAGRCRMTRRPFPLHTGIAEVVRVAPLTPTHGAVSRSPHPSCADFGVEEPGEIVTLGWSAPARELVLPRRRWRFPPGTEDQHWRNYTVRAYDPRARRSTSTSSCTATTGAPSAWASARSPATRVGFAGPRLHWEGATAAPTGRCWSPTRPACPRCWRSSRRCPAGHRATALVGADEPQQVETPRADTGPALGRRRRDCSPTRSASSSSRTGRARMGRRRGAGHDEACASTCATAARSRAARCRRSATGDAALT